MKILKRIVYSWKSLELFGRVAMILIPILIIVFSYFMILWAYDYKTGYNTSWDTAVITHKEYTPPRVEQYIFVDSEGQSHLKFRTWPSQWDVFSLGEFSDYHNDSKKLFNAVSIGDTVFVVARIGGNSGKCLRTWMTIDLSSEGVENGKVEDFGW